MLCDLLIFNNKKQKKMKFDMHVVLNVIIALVIFKILDKLFLDKLTEKVPSLMGLELDSLEIA